MNVPVRYLVWLKRTILAGVLVIISGVITMYLTGGAGSLFLFIAVLAVAAGVVFALSWSPPEDYGG